MFFVIICNRLVDSSKCGPRDFDLQSKYSSRAPGKTDRRRRRRKGEGMGKEMGVKKMDEWKERKGLAKGRKRGKE